MALSPPRHSVFRDRLSRVLGSGAEAVVLAVLILAFSRTFSVDRGEVLPLALDLTAATFAAISGRFPLTGGVGVGVTLTVWCLIPSHAPSIGVMVLFIPVFSAYVRGRRRLRNVLTAWYLVAVLIPTAGFWSDSLFEQAETVLMFALLMALTWLVARVVASLTHEVGSLQTATAEAVREERRAIARDLHDAVSAAMTRIIMRAEQARLRGISDPELAADIDFITRIGREGTRDLRAMLTALRTDDATGALEPVGPHVASLAAVIDESVAGLRRSGFTVEAKVRVDDGPLQPSTRDALGKVVREATANIIKHASPRSSCIVLIEQDDEAVEMVVVSRRAQNPVRATGARLGLIGARERVEAMGGEFSVGNGETDWVLRTRVPI